MQEHNNNKKKQPGIETRPILSVFYLVQLNKKFIQLKAFENIIRLKKKKRLCC